MSAQPEALRLADELESTWCDESCVLDKAAAELRRLSAQNAELLTVLEIIASGNTDPDRMVEIARAAIAKAAGQEGGAA